MYADTSIQSESPNNLLRYTHTHITYPLNYYRYFELRSFDFRPADEELKGFIERLEREKKMTVDGWKGLSIIPSLSNETIARTNPLSPHFRLLFQRTDRMYFENRGNCSELRNGSMAIDGVDWREWLCESDVLNGMSDTVAEDRQLCWIEVFHLLPYTVYRSQLKDVNGKEKKRLMAATEAMRVDTRQLLIPIFS